MPSRPFPVRPGWGAIKEAARRMTTRQWHVSWIAYFDNGGHIEMDGTITTRTRSLSDDQIREFRGLAKREAERVLQDEAEPEVVDLVGMGASVIYVSLTNLTRIG